MLSAPCTTMSWICPRSHVPSAIQVDLKPRCHVTVHLIWVRKLNLDYQVKQYERTVALQHVFPSTIC